MRGQSRGAEEPASPGGGRVLSWVCRWLLLRGLLGDIRSEGRFRRTRCFSPLSPFPPSWLRSRWSLPEGLPCLWAIWFAFAILRHRQKDG